MSKRYPNNALALAIANYARVVDEMKNNNPFETKDENANNQAAR